MSETKFGKSKPVQQVAAPNEKARLPNLRRGLYDFSDNT
jgi:hypothetical protein